MLEESRPAAKNGISGAFDNAVNNVRGAVYLQRIAKAKPLSRDASEIVSRMLE